MEAPKMETEKKSITSDIWMETIKESYTDLQIIKLKDKRAVIVPEEYLQKLELIGQDKINITFEVSVFRFEDKKVLDSVASLFKDVCQTKPCFKKMNLGEFIYLMVVFADHNFDKEQISELMTNKLLSAKSTKDKKSVLEVNKLLKIGLDNLDDLLESISKKHAAFTVHT